MFYSTLVQLPHSASLLFFLWVEVQLPSALILFGKPGFLHGLPVTWCLFREKEGCNMSEDGMQPATEQNGDKKEGQDSSVPEHLVKICQQHWNEWGKILSLQGGKSKCSGVR